MSVVLWRIATDAREYKADDLDGKGAERTGGRWNRPGRPVVYTASSVALACLETVVHLNAGDLPLNRFLVRIVVPDDVWAARKVEAAADLPSGWNAIPESRVSLDIGDRWLRNASSALMAVPSVVVPEEFNVLINPMHAHAAGIRAGKVRSWFYDHRLV
ncbi:MAG: RES domain-containing protein [Hydrogenophaga sp.]|uniref:RES family NAD+ phosphorylase n=1 Tax=Hydrogenophaga sp. TaxID=1904254 RepID=UPI0016A68957|nr:RES family NAD+ phosphorylase [Hydrogenophaga sp.]NIM41928.1 RES domain-containing protein [Hydrogenophaga sp.]NIN27231.1 RES domain-containing protein [Hydrogenophaga sp.]NIN31932.1 RES domain-containing protein [Hydrogenophaga sp.]NIN56325.1 RES domain-containing protein [Hydrogenophaga sp.]NIO52305.1 RES domain-containing protein [Hydrogenophaga sp.]